MSSCLLLPMIFSRMHSPGMNFVLAIGLQIFNQDPNGFWVARDPPTKEATELKAQQLAKMQEQTKQMRKHLLGEYFGDVKR